MNRTLLAAILAIAGLAAIPAPVQAGPFVETSDIVWGIGDRIIECDLFCIHIGDDPCEKVALANGCDLSDAATAWCDEGSDCNIYDPSTDHDHDLVPDTAEENVCGRQVTRDFAAGNSYTRCSTHSNMAGFPDNDRDGIPDTAEPTLCSIENDNTDLDGSCSGNNYSF